MPAPGTTATTVDPRTEAQFRRLFRQESREAQLDRLASTVEDLVALVAADRERQRSLLITGQAAIAEFATLKRPA